MIAKLNEVIPLWTKEFGTTNANISNPLQSRGEAYAKKNQPDKAEADLREALKLRLKFRPAEAPGNRHHQKQPRQCPDRTTKISGSRRAAARRPASSHRNARPRSSQHGAEPERAGHALCGDRQCSERRQLFAQGDTGRHQSRRHRDGRRAASSRVPAAWSSSARPISCNMSPISICSRPPIRRPTSAAKRWYAAQWAMQSSTSARCSSSVPASPRVATRWRPWCARTRIWRRAGASATRRWWRRCRSPTRQQNKAAIAALRQEVASLEERQKALQAKLQNEFPDYAALSSPRPLNLEQAQRLIGDGEAMVVFLPGEKESYVFAVTHTDFDWRVIPLGRAELADKVADLPQGARRRRTERLDRGRKAGVVQSRCRP